MMSAKEFLKAVFANLSRERRIQNRRLRHRIGPGERTIHSLHARIGTSKYQPHDGEQQRARQKREYRKLMARHS